MKNNTLALMTATLCLSTACLSTSVFAQQDASQKTAPAYGDNPNLIKVLAVKAQDKIQTTAEKVGAVTERGVANIKPSVDQAWQNTKEYTTEQAVIARDNTRHGIDTAVQKVKQTKENLRGKGGVPIERGSLSQASTIPMSPQSAVIHPVPVQPQVIQSIPVSPSSSSASTPSMNTSSTNSMTSNSAIPNTQSNISSHTPQNNIEFSESEIQRQSIPIQSSSASTPVNVETPASSATPSAVPQNAQEDDHTGVPR